MLVNATRQRFVHRLCLRRRRHNTKKIGCAYESGNGKRHGVRRNLVNACKTAVVYLLLTANFVQLYRLYPLFVFKICNGGIVESNMSVFAYPHYHDVCGIFIEQLAISFRLCLRVGCRNINIVDTLKRNKPKNMRF